MLKSLFTLATVFGFALSFAPRAQAEVSATVLSHPLIASVAIQTKVSALGLKWKVGDTADYKMNIGGFIDGTIHSYVREDNGTEIWVQQDAAIMGQNQKIEILFEKATGQVKKILADGKDQAIPDASNLEVVDQKEDQVTVPAGTFKAIYVKIKNKSDGKTQEAWINPQDVPINGMVKALADSQFGQVTQELTAKTFAP